MTQFRKYGALLVMAALMLLCTGCKGESPLGSRLFAEAVGVDAEADGVAVTVLGYLADAEEEGGSGCVTGMGSSVTEALARITGKTGREPYFPHNGALIVGAAAAEQGIEGILRFFTEYNGCRVGVPLFVVEGTGAAALETLSAGGDVNAQSLYRLTDPELAAGQTVRTPVYTAVTANGAGDFAVPILSVGESAAEVTGTALFHQGRMTGRLTREETTGLHILQGTLKQALIQCRLPWGRASAAIIVDDIHKEIKDGTVEVRVTCHGLLFESEFAATSRNVGPIREYLQEACSAQLTQWTNSAFEKAAQAQCKLRGWTDCSGQMDIFVKVDTEIRLEQVKS